MNENCISVIVPMHIETDLSETRSAIAKSALSGKNAELIISLNDISLEGKVAGKLERWERIVVEPKRGRGYAMLAGARKAKGDVILFLHCDTRLPDGWHEAIEHALYDKRVVGGGFGLDFDEHSFFLKVATWVSNILAYSIGEISGDRGLFVRREVLTMCENAIDVPFLEDMRLSREMRRLGKLIVLKEKVTTSAEKFRKRGYLSHSWRIALTWLQWLAGADAEKLYEYYYK